MENTTKKILIIEDEKPLSKVLKDNLEAAGNIEVSQAYDGQEGLQKAKDFKPDLILLDIIMPNIDGIGFLQVLRKDPLLGNTKVIILTNVSKYEEVSKFKELKFYDYIVKSNWNIEEVIGRIIGAL
jgi:two-component system, OmpR family, alkaline phosphatase synthesis response regulator PhoP